METRLVHDPEDLEAELGEGLNLPGLSLWLSVIERCIDLGLEPHEFLGADVPWKRLFSTGERRHV